MANNQTILLVEDDPLLQDIYTTKFKEKGWQVEIAQDGEEALKKLKKAKPAAIILDIVLPHMDGWGVLKALKEQKQTVEAKILVLSNLGQKEEIEKGFFLGADKYLIKAHYTPSEVVKEVQELLNSK